MSYEFFGLFVDLDLCVLYVSETSSVCGPKFASFTEFEWVGLSVCSISGEALRF